MEAGGGWFGSAVATKEQLAVDASLKAWLVAPCLTAGDVFSALEFRQKGLHNYLAQSLLYRRGARDTCLT